MRYITSLLPVLATLLTLGASSMQLCGPCKAVGPNDLNGGLIPASRKLHVWDHMHGGRSHRRGGEVLCMLSSLGSLMRMLC
ncbi:hypothetical protein CLAFUW4_20098 [Fulvia fulva]|uniref:uncharacterized protein n=1 Tax=Passalora fulva TaxID=5499 RepID=UPI0028529863|nr:uncharacterized protein CLAFUR5_20098 [Fulvia fulva]KAK4612007.1 hypothetical protein CLAFUR4_20098 [Fulvia fulva]KAK4612366.1 hypothetical protein CLAFUR0_20098 [Fulvia fulva]WMI39055.1 hypothetical protein CLAFUR5_20098 [Fulvia fulva]WPV21293.1 hypothetical protein CLAFUW4_20098 [Fulvia fulva]WPV35980.1 hypothetical protein CLAFUW7_20098 [Fulvia fulva]